MNNVERIIRSPLGAIVARPWFDTFVLGFFTHWFFPLSRLWGAARAANGCPETFFSEVPMVGRANLELRLAAVLSEFENRRAAAAAADEQWEVSFFGNQPRPSEHLSEIEKQRLDHSARYNDMRRKFSFLRRGNSIPPIRWDVRSPMESAVQYAQVIRHPDRLFMPAEDMPEVRSSNAFTDHAGTHFWLQFASPSNTMADMVTARVLEPPGAENAPTVIFLHGICVEFDHWHGMLDDLAELSRQGIRTIRVEAPWHGRRVPAGRYGGEKFIGTMPYGSLDYFSAQVKEVAVLMDWCRRNTTGPVALGGSSLGAHVARLIATRAKQWSKMLQPDALLLITPCEKLEDAAITGAFADVWKTVENSMRLGWTPSLRSKYFSLIDPTENPCVNASHTVAVLGTHDRVTPFPSGQRLMKRLNLPAENIFVRRQGHFSTPLNLARDKVPMNRFCRLLTDLS